MKYSFSIIETYCKTIEIESKSLDEAYDTIMNNYEAGEIVLDDNDFQEWEIYPNSE